MRASPAALRLGDRSTEKQSALRRTETPGKLPSSLICAGYMYIYAMHDSNRLMSAMSIDGIWQNNVHSKSTAELGFSALVTVEFMHAGVSRAVSQASVVLQRPGYGFSQAFCWCSFAGTLTSQASPAPIRDSSRAFPRRNRASY